MFGIGTGEILLILVIAMLVVGPERMVTFARQLGHLVAQFRRTTDEATQEFREAFSLEGGAEEPQPTAAPEAAAPAEALPPVPAEAPSSAEPTAQTGGETEPVESVTLEDVLADELVDGEIEVEAPAQPPGNETEAQPEPPVEATEGITIDVAALVPEDQDVEPTIIETVEMVPQETVSSPAHTEG